MCPESVAKRPRVYLHVGAPKTGTTFLQGVLWKNRDVLKDRGVWLPGNRPNHHFRAGFDLRGLKPDQNDPRGSWIGEWDAMAAQIRHCDSDSVVVSDERLAACSVGEIERAVSSLAPAEVHVIYTTRGLAELFPAEWQEHIKAHDTRTFEAWLEDITADRQRGKSWFWKVHDVANVLGRWSTVVPASRLHVLTLPPPGSPPDLLWERFASVLDIDAGGLDTDVRANASLGAEGAELVRRVNETLPPEFPAWHRVELLREVLAHRILAPRASKTKITLSAKWTRWVEEYVDQLIIDLKGFDCDFVGDLNELTPGDNPVGRSEAAPPSDVVDPAVAGIAGLLVRMGELRDVRAERNAVRDAEREVARERDAALARAAEAEALVREHRELPPVERIKRTVVELGGQSKLVGGMLGVWRKAKTLTR